MAENDPVPAPLGAPMKWLDRRRRHHELLKHVISDYVTAHSVQELSLPWLIAPALSMRPRIDLLAEYDGKLLSFRGVESESPIAPATPPDCTFFAEVFVPPCGDGPPRFVTMRMGR